jgi:glucosamine--fructose-6-phosphate aminotransferase (isomerizing)
MSQFTDEIQVLPDALGRLVSFYRREGRERLHAWAQQMCGCQYLLCSGMGTSAFAPLAIRSTLAEAGIACCTMDAGEWLHYGRPQLAAGAGRVALLSQSGESVEIIRLLEQEGFSNELIALTNHEDSTLGRRASLVLPLCAGAEASISTKTYTNTLGVLYLLAAVLRPGDLDEEQRIDWALDDLERAAAGLRATDPAQIQPAAEFLLPGDALAFVGRGPAYVAACQSALTFMEGARCLAAAFSGGGFRHGPFESVGPDFRLVIFAPAGLTESLLTRLGRDAAAHGARVVMITDAATPAETNIQVIRVPTPDTASPERLFPLLVSGVHPWLLHFLAQARGIEAGRFRYCQKITEHE